MITLTELDRGDATQKKITFTGYGMPAGPLPYPQINRSIALPDLFFQLKQFISLGNPVS